MIAIYNLYSVNKLIKKLDRPMSDVGKKQFQKELVLSTPSNQCLQKSDDDSSSSSED